MAKKPPPEKPPALPAGAETLIGVPEGYDGSVLGQLAAETSAIAGRPMTLVHVARDDRRVGELEASLAFFSPAPAY
ncbi:MAG: hypothetical protein R3D67_11820 [Hyphomicrobiaceae bacterium]